MTIPVELPFEHDGVPGTGELVKSQYAMSPPNNGHLYLTFMFKLTDVSPETFNSIVNLVQEAIGETASRHGGTAISSGNMGIIPPVDTPDDDGYYSDDDDSYYSDDDDYVILD